MTKIESAIWAAAYGAAFVEAARVLHSVTGRGYFADVAHERTGECTELARVAADAAVAGYRETKP